MSHRVFRLYRPDELGLDGYPTAWHRQEGNSASAIKVLVRLLAGNRCVRCLHPYVKGTGEWSACDGRCTHGGPLRYGPHGHEFDADALQKRPTAGVLSSLAPAVWRPACHRHHGMLDQSKTLRISRSAIPVETEAWALEHGLDWWLTEAYGERP